MKKLFLSFLVVLLFCGCVLAADDSFPLKDISVDYNSLSKTSIIEGEITNNSGEDYASASFTLSFYDADDKVIGTADIHITDFANESTSAIKSMSVNDLTDWKTCKVVLVSKF